MRNLIFLFLTLVSLTLRANEVGGDISLLTQYEQHGAKYYDTDGKSIADMLTYLRQCGLTSMRLRLFVNPENASSEDKGQGVCQDLDYVKVLGARIKAAGFTFMLDFHYSDSWADPVKQYTPEAWKNLNDTQLNDKIYEYTRDCLQQLAAAGAAPDYIQTGNEISYGMLWGPVGTPSSQLKKFSVGDQASTDRFTVLLASACRACREVCPQAKIVVHTELVRNISLLRSFYNAVAQVDYDIIGLSYYPYYHYGLNQLESALFNIESNPSCDGKQIMIVETGYYHKWQPDNINYDYSATYPISAAGQRAFAAALVQKLLNHPRVTGLYWWWPEANEYGLDWATRRVTDNWYNAGMWDNQTGRALPALLELPPFAPRQAGDITGDGNIDVADINAVINIMLGRTSEADYKGKADVTGDGTIDVADANAVISVMVDK